MAQKGRWSTSDLFAEPEITLERAAPMGDPRAYSLMGYRLSLRNKDARNVLLRIE